MKINVILIGKTKEVEFGEYVKRISGFANLDVREVKEFGVEKIRALDGHKVLLDERGVQMSSEDFAGFLGKHKDMGETVNFVVGGAYGFNEEERAEADLLLSFSKMTFTHQMIRLFLFEQIYRGLSILAGKAYHNE
jgi:23S rRNA (pseudouridine1915-N3)-methyltransferase